MELTENKTGWFHIGLESNEVLIRRQGKVKHARLYTHVPTGNQVGLHGSGCRELRS